MDFDEKYDISMALGIVTLLLNVTLGIGLFVLKNKLAICA